MPPAAPQAAPQAAPAPSMIDLLSDAVTRPSEAMIAAMAAHARVVRHSMRNEDPAVRELERRAAEVLGMEAAVLCATGTMANQVAIRAHCQGVAAPLVVAEARSHVVEHEGAGVAVNAGAELKGLPGDRGAMRLDLLAEVLAPAPSTTALLHAEPALVVVENSHNFAGGAALPLAHARDVARLARARGVPVHLDGARVFNAALALGVEARAISAEADTAMFSLTKGLGAPYGAMLAGPAAFVERARRFRQVMGGGVYKQGILAAAGLVALEEGVPRLAEDHAHARLLGDALAKAGAGVARVDTNIVVFEVPGVPAERVAGKARARGVRVAAISAREARAVLHRDVPREDAVRAAQALASAVAEP